MSETLIRCPFCGEEEMYETKRENELGTIIPQLFCNCCKMTFEIENDSPYLNDDKTYDYLKEKLHNLWNTRKPMQVIVERLKKEGQKMSEAKSMVKYGKASPSSHRYYKAVSVKKAIEIVKEEGGVK